MSWEALLLRLTHEHPKLVRICEACVNNEDIVAAPNGYGKGPIWFGASRTDTFVR
jgi:hypothetical protein